MKKIYIYLIIIALLVVILGIMLKFTLFNNETNKSNNNNSTNTVTSTDVDTIKEDAESKNRGDDTYSNYTATINLNELSVSGNGITITGSTIKISAEGTYYFTGTSDNANIVIDAGDDDNIVLVFENANITSKTTSVINGINSKNIIINLKEGSVNTFTDSSNYTEFTDDDEPNAIIFSKTDLKITGKGTLTINANYQDGIASKDDLIITNATLKIKAKDDAIRGKDSVNIKNANITITAEGDSIKSTNEEDETKGYVIIDGGNITISSGDDGIHAETALIIEDGTINITKSYEGLEGMHIEINGGDINIISTDDGINATSRKLKF